MARQRRANFFTECFDKLELFPLARYQFNQTLAAETKDADSSYQRLSAVTSEQSEKRPCNQIQLS